MKLAKLILLIFLLSSCGGEGMEQDCEQVRITPPVGNPYWVTICSDNGGVPVSPANSGQKGE